MKKNQGFTQLIIGQTVANVGDTIYIVAIISSIFSWTDSALAAALVPVLVTGGGVISGFLAPVITSYFRLEQVLKVSQMCKTALLFFMTAYLYLKAETMNLLVLYCLVALISFLDGCSEPISRVLIPKYVEKHRLVKANGIFNSMLQTVNIGSWAIGTSLLLVFSVHQLVLLDSFLFLSASIVLAFLPRTTREKNEKQPLAHQLFIGWRWIMKDPLVRVIVGMDMLESIANTAWVSAIVLVFVREVMQAPDAWWGYINATYFVGALLGSALVMRFSERFDKNKRTAIVMGAILGGLITVAVALLGDRFLILGLSVLIGLFSQIKNIPQASLIQQKVAADRLVAIYAASGILNSGVFALFTLLMGQVADVFDVRWVFVLSGSLLLLVGLIAGKLKIS
ncbi:MFS transporter [Enterococcus innesii]|uniref:MFS transporter n=1 Tax=Enterococcus innesii TaxID=2839759 RepID=UPI0034A3AAB4